MSESADDETSTIVSEQNNTTQILISIQQKLNQLETKINNLEHTNPQSLTLIDNNILQTFLIQLNLDYVVDAIFDTKLVPQDDIHTDGRFLISKDILISIIFSSIYIIIILFLIYKYFQRLRNSLF